MPILQYLSLNVFTFDEQKQLSTFAIQCT